MLASGEMVGTPNSWMVDHVANAIEMDDLWDTPISGNITVIKVPKAAKVILVETDPFVSQNILVEMKMARMRFDSGMHRSDLIALPKSFWAASTARFDLSNRNLLPQLCCRSTESGSCTEWQETRFFLLCRVCNNILDL